MEAKARRVFWELGKGERVNCAWVLVLLILVGLALLGLVQLVHPASRHTFMPTQH